MANPTGAQRRRSQRVYLLIQLEIAWTTKEDVFVQEHVETEEVNAHGATLWIKRCPPAETPVELTNSHTGKSALARVVAERKLGPAGYKKIAVALAVPSYVFWGVVFPPGPQQVAPLVE